jgi:hypothetical protein
MRKTHIKMVEIRDRGTCIPAFAIKMLPDSNDEAFLMKQTGYGFSHPCVMLVSIEAPWHSARSWDEWKNSPRTMPNAHKYIEENFNGLKDCEVIDVEFLLGEVDKPCKSCKQESFDEMIAILKNQAGEDDEVST